MKAKVKVYEEIALIPMAPIIELMKNTNPKAKRRTALNLNKFIKTSKNDLPRENKLSISVLQFLVFMAGL